MESAAGRDDQAWQRFSGRQVAQRRSGRITGEALAPLDQAFARPPAVRLACGSALWAGSLAKHMRPGTEIFTW